MTIEREIGGVRYTLELTSAELVHAYYEQEHLFDIMDIENALRDYEDIDPSLISKEIISDAAYEMRRSIDKYGCDWSYARDDAVETLKSRYRIASFVKGILEAE